MDTQVAAQVTATLACLPPVTSRERGEHALPSLGCGSVSDPRKALRIGQASHLDHVSATELPMQMSQARTAQASDTPDGGDCHVLAGTPEEPAPNFAKSQKSHTDSPGRDPRDVIPSLRMVTETRAALQPRE